MSQTARIQTGNTNEWRIHYPQQERSILQILLCCYIYECIVNFIWWTEKLSFYWILIAKREIQTVYHHDSPILRLWDLNLSWFPLSPSQDPNHMLGTGTRLCFTGFASVLSWQPSSQSPPPQTWLVTVDVIKIKQPRFPEHCNSWVFDAARIGKIQGTTQ